MAGETVLVIDDDPFMIELLTDSMSAAGYTVVTAEDGQQARHVMNSNEFQVALIDLSLPDLDGMELVKDISNESPDAQIIIMTGFPSLESAIEALRNGAQDYIVKPFKVPEIQAAVGRALNNQRLQAEVRELRRRVRDLEQEVHRLRGEGARPQAARPAPLPGAYGTAPARRPPAEAEAEGAQSEAE